MKSVAADSRPKTWLTRDQNSPRPLPIQPVLLSNGLYNVRLSEVGSGYSELSGVAITRSAADETRDADGFYIYLCDLDDGKTWSAAAEPAQYGRTGKLSFYMDAAGVRSADVGGKPLPPPKN